MTTRLSRRRFVQLSTAGSLGYFFTGSAASVGKVYGANEMLHVAGIGVGGKGSSDIDQAGSLMEVVALCDIDSKRLAPKAKKWEKAKTFSDYRKLYDDKDLVKLIDAVVVSTPDHNHALACAMAIRNGKHVYCQKPLTRTVFESHLLRKLATENKVCTQMGNQGTSENGLRRAVELVQSGILGSVKEVHVWTNRPIWPQAPKITARPAKEDPVPENIDWEAFIGPAPMRPFAGNRTYHDFAWRGWWDFGTGAIGDMACHTANMAFMALKLGHPNFASAEATDVNSETCPSSAHVTLKFPERNGLAPVTLNWYEGQKDGKKLVPPEELLAKVLKKDEKLVNSGSILVGDKAILYSPNDYGAAFRITPAPDVMNLTKPETLPINGKGDQGQKDEWVAAIKAGTPTLAMANFDYASYLTAAFLLGNVAIRTGKAFEFNGETLEAKGCPEAAQYIKSEYRKGWDMLEG